MIQGQSVTDAGTTSPPDPWSGWARLADVPAPVEDEANDNLEDVGDVGDIGDVDDGGEPDVAPEHADASAAPPAEAEAVAETQPAPPNDDLVTAVARLAAELADERRMRASAEHARREAEARLHTAQTNTGSVGAELVAAKARIAELERDRDEVIRRAEELLSAVRERADQRLAAEVDEARRHWSELLAEEHRRVEALEVERASLAQRAEDAWLAAAVLRRSRPLRPRSSTPTTLEAAEGEVLEDLEEHETDAVLAADSPHLAAEIELLRQRLRARLHKPPEMDDVEDGVDQLREARLAREPVPRGRRRK